MKKYLLALSGVILMCLPAMGVVTLEQCLDAARANYPLIKRYDLLAATQDVELSDIDKSWLPHIDAYARVSAQNVVPSFPETLSDMMRQMGGDVKGLGKVQYKVGVDATQMVWDGGATRARRDVTRADTEVKRAALDVQMYGIRTRVESLFFGILLLQQQIEQTRSAMGVYEANLERLRSMLASGTAMQSDVDMVEAAMLEVKQRLTAAQSTRTGYLNVLSLFTALELADEPLAVPDVHIPDELTSRRPELSLYDARLALSGLQRAAIDASLKPKVGLFAQGYYGYPGIDYFKAMMKRTPSFNIVAGVSVSWSADALYTRHNSLRKIQTVNSEVEEERQTFLFNNRMQCTSELEQIHSLEAQMQDDARIEALRANVRKAAESQLRGGVIDATALITKINDETQAALTAAYHRILLTQAICNLKNTLNR